MPARDFSTRLLTSVKRADGTIITTPIDPEYRTLQDKAAMDISKRISDEKIALLQTNLEATDLALEHMVANSEYWYGEYADTRASLEAMGKAWQEDTSKPQIHQSPSELTLPDVSVALPDFLGGLGETISNLTGGLTAGFAGIGVFMAIVVILIVVVLVTGVI